MVLMVEECYRHAKAIGAWGEGRDALVEAGCAAGDAGVVVDDTPAGAFEQVVELMGTHRVWNRFPTTVG